MQVRQLQTPGELAVNRDTLRGTALGAAETVCPELLTKRSDSLGSCVLGERGGGKCQAGFLLLRHVPWEKPGQTLRGDVGVSGLLGGLDVCMLVTYAELTCSHCRWCFVEHLLFAWGWEGRSHVPVGLLLMFAFYKNDARI